MACRPNASKRCDAMPNILVAGTAPRPLDNPKSQKNASAAATTAAASRPEFVIARPNSRRRDRRCDAAKSRAGADERRELEGRSARKLPGKVVMSETMSRALEPSASRNAKPYFRSFGGGGGAGGGGPSPPKGCGKAPPRSTSSRGWSPPLRQFHRVYSTPGRPMTAPVCTRREGSDCLGNRTASPETSPESATLESMTIGRLGNLALLRGLPKEGDAFRSLAEWLSAGVEQRSESIAEIHRYLTGDDRTFSELLQGHDDMDSEAVPGSSPPFQNNNPFGPEGLDGELDTLAAALRNVEPGLNTQRHDPKKILLREVKTLWEEIPKGKRNPSDRDQAATLAKALDVILEEIGAPLRVPNPPDLPGNDEDQDKEAQALEALRRWNVAEPIAPELHVLDRVLHELVRQTSVHCWERGQLLQRVRVRYWNILEEVITMSSIIKRDLMSLRKHVGRLMADLARCKDEKSQLKKRLNEETRTAQRQRGEIEKCEERVGEMERRLRRGRFDIIEEELFKYKFHIDKQTADFVEKTKHGMEEEYKEKLRSALKDLEVMGEKRNEGRPE